MVLTARYMCMIDFYMRKVVALLVAFISVVAKVWSTLGKVVWAVIGAVLLVTYTGAILLKSETKHEDMIDILASLQQYVPLVQYAADEKIMSTGEEVRVWTGQHYLLSLYNFLFWANAYLRCIMIYLNPSCLVVTN